MALFTIPASDKRVGSEVQLCTILNKGELKTFDDGGKVIEAEVEYTDYVDRKPYPKYLTISFWDSNQTGWMNATAVNERAVGDKILVQIGVRADNSCVGVRVGLPNTVMTIEYDGKKASFIYGRIGKADLIKNGNQQALLFEVPVLRGGKKEIVKTAYWPDASDPGKLDRMKAMAQPGLAAVFICASEKEGGYIGKHIFMVTAPKQPNLQSKEPDVKEAPAPAKAPVPAADEKVSVKEVVGLKEGEVLLTIGDYMKDARLTIKDAYKKDPAWVEYIAFCMEPFSDDPARAEMMRKQQASCKTYLQAIGVKGPQQFKVPASAK